MPPAVGLRREESEEKLLGQARWQKDRTVSGDVVLSDVAEGLFRVRVWASTGLLHPNCDHGPSLFPYRSRRVSFHGQNYRDLAKGLLVVVSCFDAGCSNRRLGRPLVMSVPPPLQGRGATSICPHMMCGVVLVSRDVGSR
jgi:hypothetical protein